MSKRIEYRFSLLWFVPFSLLLMSVCFAPFIWIVMNSVQDGMGNLSFQHYQEIFGNPFYMQSITSAFWLALTSSFLGLVIGLIAVNSITKVPNKISKWALSFTNMSSHFSGVPLAFAFMILMGTNGVITLLLKSWGVPLGFTLYSLNGLIVVYTYFQIPLAILLLYPAFSLIDPNWKDAAKLLGASNFYYIRTVLIPMLLPALFGTFVMLMANSLGAYATAYALTSGNINLLVIRISSLVVGDIFLNPTLAAALSIILMAQLVLITLFNRLMLVRRFDEV
ncbi:ABC transporter permease [Thorsellia anophelis]|uniref:Putative spermidine/putrescine transport system permease protein n=1 Tax=Thorsellia anophelis DSM 18579 TaxID=1123402 RepID=A0A1I0FZ39_9GAMM|nr:ABC transporter permease subunit [Thorsellia anophelis]SET62855.1 putative spermidine/putrescine transport system permease protein [Thorsellia anophelis DSM 18579]